MGVLTHLPLTKGLIFLLFSPGALSTLEQEIVPDSPPASASKKYRKSLALSLFYKVHVLGVIVLRRTFVLVKFSWYSYDPSAWVIRFVQNKNNLYFSFVLVLLDCSGWQGISTGQVSRRAFHSSCLVWYTELWHTNQWISINKTYDETGCQAPGNIKDIQSFCQRVVSPTFKVDLPVS